MPAGGARRIVYLGTPEVAVPPLRALVAAGVEIALVITRVDKRRGRGSALSPSPVKQTALELGLRVSHDLADAVTVRADLGVVVAYGRIIPMSVLSTLPMINVHFSLLPRWRGAAPVERAILAGDVETGVCLMDVDVELDTGAVHAVARTAITDDDTLESLRGRLVALGSQLLVDTLRIGLGDPTPQEGEVTHAAKIEPAELCIDWSSPAIEIDRLVRLGGAWTGFRGERLKVHAATVVDRATDHAEPGKLDGTVVSCGRGAIELREVQPAGRGRQTAGAWRNGARPALGERFDR